MSASTFLKKSTVFRDVTMHIKDTQKITYVAIVVIVQCVVVFILAGTVLGCAWKVEKAFTQFDYDTLVRIMYLYDPYACGAAERIKTQGFAELHLSNDTMGFNVLPIKNLPPVSMISTRLSSKTRVYIKFSVYIHSIWCAMSIAMIIIVKKTIRFKIVKIALSVYFLSFILMIIFDISMGIIYIAHIQQSLTKSMIIRYSGWVDINMKNPNDFAGWLPMVGSVCWLRGLVILAINIYFTNLLSIVRKKINKREVRRRLRLKGFIPIPNPMVNTDMDDDVLLYRSGDDYPTFTRNIWSSPF